MLCEVIPCMHAKAILALLFLVSVAVAALVFVRALPPDGGVRVGGANPSPGREILVAIVPLPASTLLRAQDVSWWTPSTDTPYLGEILRPAAAKRETKPEIDA